MPRCGICRHEYAGAEDLACPKCGHRDKCEGSESSAQGPAKKRFVSAAGPSVPVRLSQNNDSTPSSWMGRLQAARLVTEQSSQGSAGAPPALTPTRARPSALGVPTALYAFDSKGLVPKTPAPQPESAVIAPVQELKAEHRLLRELEPQDEAQAKRVLELRESTDIATVDIPLKMDGVKKRRVPDWVVGVMLVLMAMLLTGLVFRRARKEPIPLMPVSPAVQAATDRKRQAIAAFEEGNGLALQGHAEAVQAYQRALELDPTLARAERGLAIAFASHQDEHQAAVHYRAYLTLTPDASDAEEVRKILSQFQDKWDKSAQNKAHIHTHKSALP